MLWTSLYLRAYKLPAVLRKRLHPGTNGAFRVLLFVGDLLALLLFWFIWSLQRHSPALHGYNLWIAGLAATLWILFACARASARLNGYGRNHDPWLRLAATIMVVLCFVAVISY
jgi:hypothetical protein